MHTSEEMILEAPSLHELIDKKPMIIFNTKTNQLDEIWMMQLPKERDLSLKKYTPQMDENQRKWNASQKDRNEMILKDTNEMIPKDKKWDENKMIHQKEKWNWQWNDSKR